MPNQSDHQSLTLRAVPLCLTVWTVCVVVLAATTATVSQPGSIESQYIFRGAQLPLAIGVTVTICHFALM